MLKILIIAVLLIGIGASALSPIEDPDVLKVFIYRDGAEIGLVAFQDANGQWIVGFTDMASQSYYIGNGTGIVMIT
jgi:hypothetical protein